MKITWTVALLASSVTAVHAQQTPRPVQAPKSPLPATAPTPAPAPRAERPEPMLPGVDWLLDAPGAMTLIAPFPPLPSIAPSPMGLPGLAPLPMELPMLAPLPGQMSLGIDVPMAIDFPSMPAPGEWMIEPMLPPTSLAPWHPGTPRTLALGLPTGPGSDHTAACTAPGSRHGARAVDQRAGSC